MGWSNGVYGTPCWDAYQTPGDNFAQPAIEDAGEPGAGREVIACLDGTDDVGETSADVGTGGAGRWVVYHSLEGGLKYTKVGNFTDLDPDDDSGTTCVEGVASATGQYPLVPWTSALITVHIATDQVWWRSHHYLDSLGREGRELRAFVSSYHRACGVMELRANLVYNADDSWSVAGDPDWLGMDYDSDYATHGDIIETASACKPVPLDGEVRGMTLTSDGRWLMVYGGPPTSAGQFHEQFLPQAANNMGVCAIRVGDTRCDGTSCTATWPDATAPQPDEYCVNHPGTCVTMEVPYHAEQAVDRSLPVSTYSLVAHPYLEGAYFGGVNASSCQSCPLDYPVLAPYALQRPWALDMSWGMTSPDAEMTRLYHGASIGGMWEGELRARRAKAWAFGRRSLRDGGASTPSVLPLVSRRARTAV